MNTYYSVRGGFLARQLNKPSPYYLVPSFRWWHQGNALITIPLDSCNKMLFIDRADNYNYASDFLDEIEKQKFEEISICDLNKFMWAVAALFNQFRRLKEKANIDDKIYASVSIENTYHVSPFIDDEKFIEQIRENGIPLIEDDSFRIPENYSPENLIDLNRKDESSDEKFASDPTVQAILKTLPIFASVFFAFGIMADLEDLTKFRKIFDIRNVEDRN